MYDYLHVAAYNSPHAEGAGRLPAKKPRFAKVPFFRIAL